MNNTEVKDIWQIRYVLYKKSMCQGEENKIIKIIFHCIICPFQWSDHMLKSNSATEASFKEHFPKYWSELIQKSLKVYIKISCWWINDGDLAPIATRQGDRLSNMNWSLKIQVTRSCKAMKQINLTFLSQFKWSLSRF